MMVTLLLPAILFVAGLVKIFSYFPSARMCSWFHLFFPVPSCDVAAVTKQRPSRETTELRSVFSTFDKNGDGFITKQELVESLQNMGMSVTKKDVEEMFAKVDSNGDGLIDLVEFCGLWLSISHEEGVKGSGEEDLKEAFDVFDKDRDGLITAEELGFVLSSMGLREGNKKDNCREMIRKFDADGDGMVNFDEFKNMMKGGRLVFAY